MILLIAVLIIMGPKRLPQAGRSLGRGIREFKDGITGRDDASEQAQLSPEGVTTPLTNTASVTATDHTSGAEPTSTVISGD
jgi:sec-independent protein translocase protein TatA